MPDPIAVDAAGAAQLLGISERQVRDWTAEGLLPAIDVDDHRRRIYSVEALRRWALERSGYIHAEEEDHAEAVPAQGRTLVRRGPGRPRQPRASRAPLPLRSVER